MFAHVLPPVLLGLLATLGDQHAVTPDYPTNKWFGHASVWLDDVDGDGWHDLAVPDPELPLGDGPERGHGVVLILSGADGRVLRAIQPRPGERHLGWGLATTDDLDDDGSDELVVWGATASSAGFVRAVSPSSGEVHWETADAPRFTYVLGVETIPDRDGDEVRDLVVWGDDPEHAGEGDAWQRFAILSGASGRVLTEVAEERPRWFRISNMRPIEDVDDDGLADLVLLSYETDEANVTRQRVELRSGATGKKIGEWSPVGKLTSELEVADLDDDGRSEVLVSLPYSAFSSAADPGDDQPSAGTVLVLDVETRGLERVLVVRARGAFLPVTSFDVLRTAPSPTGDRAAELLVAGSSEAFEEAVHALDLREGRWAWRLGGAVATERARTDDLLTSHLGEHVAIDRFPDAEGRYSALTGTGNPYWGHNHTLWVFDPLCGDVRFIVDAHGLFEEAGL